MKACFGGWGSLGLERPEGTWEGSLVVGLPLLSPGGHLRPCRQLVTEIAGKRQRLVSPGPAPASVPDPDALSDLCVVVAPPAHAEGHCKQRPTEPCGQWRGGESHVLQTLTGPRSPRAWSLVLLPRPCTPLPQFYFSVFLPLSWKLPEMFSGGRRV